MRRLHARKFWDVDGVTYPEPLSVFGLDAIGTTADGRSSPRHLHYHYTSGMVFALMMLGHDSYTGTQIARLRGARARHHLLLRPVLSEETPEGDRQAARCQRAPGHLSERRLRDLSRLRQQPDVLAGLTALARDLLDTPPERSARQKRAYLEGFRKRIPDFKIEEKDGRKLYAAADKPRNGSSTTATWIFPRCTSASRSPPCPWAAPT